MLFWYRIDGALAVGAPWWRRLLSRSPAGILLRTGGTFPPAHPTTKMCLHLMLHDLRARRRRNLVDVGCGTGVLALAGLKLGVERAVAIDISARAIVISRVNAVLNGVKHRLRLVQGSSEGLGGRFDLVVANLPMPALGETLRDLVRLSSDEASLILSGFQDVDRVLVEDAAGRLGLAVERWLSGDLTSVALPPSRSFTWMAVLARRNT